MEKFERRPTGFGVKFLYLGRQTRVLLNEEGKGFCHAIYYGDSKSGTHKDNLSEIVLNEADKRNIQQVAVISSGSTSTALLTDIILTHPWIQLYELVSYESLPVECQSKGFSVEALANSSEAPVRIKIGLDKGIILDHDAIEKYVVDILESNRKLKQFIRRRGIRKWKQVLDVTNPHDIFDDEPVYGYDKRIFAGYDYVIAPFGTGNLFYSLQCAVNQLEDSKRPVLIGVTNQGHPITKELGAPEVEVHSDASKVTTPCLNSTTPYIVRDWRLERDFIYTPTEMQIQAAHGSSHIMQDEHSDPGDSYRQLHCSEVWEKRRGLIFSQENFLGYDVRAGQEVVNPRLCSTGSLALTALHKDNKKVAAKSDLRGLQLFNIHMEPLNSKRGDILIPLGSNVLVLLTGKSRNNNIYTLASKVYDKVA